jgi:hypothetical protein
VARLLDHRERAARARVRDPLLQRAWHAVVLAGDREHRDAGERVERLQLAPILLPVGASIVRPYRTPSVSGRRAPGSLPAMDARSIARLQSLGRLALGAGLMVSPGTVAGGWVGGVADKREGQALAVAVGARDVALALGALRALSAGHGAGAWLRGGMLADAADLVATLRARDAIPALAVPAVATLAGGSVLLAAWLQGAVD